MKFVTGKTKLAKKPLSYEVACHFEKMGSTGHDPIVFSFPFDVDVRPAGHILPNENGLTIEETVALMEEIKAWTSKRSVVSVAELRMFKNFSKAFPEWPMYSINSIIGFVDVPARFDRYEITHYNMVSIPHEVTVEF